MLVANETQLRFLFGDAKKAIAFYKKTTSSDIQDVKLVRDTTQSKVMELDIYKLCDDVCKTCKDKEMFPDCRHLARRIVGECNGAMPELVWNDLMK
jgi:hypothetical protein